MRRSRIAWILFCGVLAGCTTSAPPNTIRICEQDGCADRPLDYSNPAPPRVGEEASEYRLESLKQLAAKDPRAAYDLALRLFRGDGVRQDSYQALVWMRDAAERGDLHAQKALGRVYLTGLEEMGPDPQEAEKWLTIAAGRGDKESAGLLAQASDAKKSDIAHRRWTEQWRPIFYGYWYESYPYQTYWNDGGWEFF